MAGTFAGYFVARYNTIILFSICLKEIFNLPDSIFSSFASSSGESDTCDASFVVLNTGDVPEVAEGAKIIIIPVYDGEGDEATITMMFYKGI